MCGLIAMKVLVTGANGFLGHWLVKTLVDKGLDVDALVRPKSDITELEGVKCRYAFGDVTDLESLKKNFADVDTVFHLAGVIGYKPSDRSLMEKVNVEGTANVIEAVKRQNVKKLVHLSSVVAVGAGFSKDEILNEKSPFNVAHLHMGYYDTKYRAEILVQESFKRGEIDTVILNPSTIYGAGDAKKGSRSSQVKVAQGRFNFYTSGGVNICPVEDAVDGIISAWKKGKSGERYILAGENITIKKLFELIAKSANVPAPEIAIPNWLLHTLGFIGDNMQRIGLESKFSSENAWTTTLFHWFDSKKAQAELDFTFQSAETAINKSVQWMKEHGYLGQKS